MKSEKDWAEEIRHAVDADLSFAEQQPSLLPRILTQLSAADDKRKKKTVGIVLAALLLMMALTGLAVSVLGGFVFLDAEEHGQPYACVVKDGSLFVLAKNGLWVYPSGREQAERLIARKNLPRFRNPLQLELLASEPLMLMDRNAEVVWEVKNGHFVQKDSYAGTPLAKICRHGTDYVWQAGALYVQSDHDGNIYRADLKGRTVEKLPLEKVTRLTEYREGWLLALTYSEQEGTSVVVIDATNQTQQVLCTDPGLGIKWISYSPENDAIYAIVSGSLSRWNENAWQTICGAALPHVTFFAGVFGNAYAAANYQGIQFIPLNQAETKTKTLTIIGVADSAAYDHGFQQANHGITVARRNEIEFEMEDAIQALQSGTEADLLHVRIATDQVEELWNLLVPVESEKLMADSAAMLPVLQSLMTSRNKLYAVPSTMIVDAWESTDRPPTVLKDMLEQTDFRIGEETFVGNEIRTVLWGKKEYAAWLLKQGIGEWKAGSLRFTDEGFADTLQTIVDMPDAESTENIWLHTSVSLVGYLHGSTGMIPYTAPPMLRTNVSPTIPVWITAYVINPASPNREEAIRYLEYLAEHRFSWEDALMKPESAQPVLIEWAEERIVQLPENDAQRKMIESNPENWEVLAENLQYYWNEIAPHIVIGDGSVHVLNDSEQEMMNAIERCIQGKMTAGECAALLEEMAEELY